MSSNGRKRALGSASGRPPKIRKPRKPASEDEDSNDSTSAEQQQDPQRELSPIIDDPNMKLPEELLKSFYKKPGRLLIAGCVSWDLVAKRDNNPNNRSHPNLYTFHKFTDRKYRLIISGCSAGHSILISEEGDAYTFGRNPCGQLGFGDTVTRNVPELVPTLKGMNIIHAAVGRHHSLFVTDTGAVYACGDNKSGQCGVGNNTPNILKPTRVRYTGTPIVKVGCGAEFSMILDCNGALHSFGLPEYGQLGHNTDGKYFVTSTKLSYHFETIPKHIALFFEKSKDGHVAPVKDVAVVDFSCGNNHTVAIDSKKRAYSWGFGGFGRLGHAEQKDESVPRLIKYFDSASRGVRSVHCGATYSLAVNEHGCLFLFGQTKRTGEANMYPKPVQDLQGWNVRCVGTSCTSIVLCADDSLIAWGVAPTYGELGTGEINKSTARPKENSAKKWSPLRQKRCGVDGANGASVQYRVDPARSAGAGYAWRAGARPASVRSSVGRARAHPATPSPSPTKTHTTWRRTRIALNENQQFELQRIDVEPCEATPVKEVPNEKPSFKATMQADDKPEVDMSGNLNSFWARGPVYQEAKTQQEEVRNHRVLYRPPQSLTRLSKTVASGLNPHFNKGYFEPFESRPKPVKLVGIRKNGIFPRKNIEIVSKSSEVAELQSPYNDISNFWLDDPGMPQLKNV